MGSYELLIVFIVIEVVQISTYTWLSLHVISLLLNQKVEIKKHIIKIFCYVFISAVVEATIIYFAWVNRGMIIIPFRILMMIVTLKWIFKGVLMQQLLYMGSMTYAFVNFVYSLALATSLYLHPLYLSLYNPSKFTFIAYEVSIYFIFSSFFIFLIRVIDRKSNVIIRLGDVSKNQKIVILILVLLILIISIYELIITNMGLLALLIFSGTLFWFILGVSYISMLINEKFDKQTLEQKEALLLQQQKYTNEIEKQYTEMRIFKHDYQNILLSLEGYLMARDCEGLKEYYYQKIKVVSDRILQDDFILERLHKIKIREVKSILATKLILAQGLGMDVTLEAEEDIKDIGMDSIVLVRIIGIILDNAIEALSELEDGKLRVAIFKNGTTTTFIVQNTCRSEMPKVHELKQLGFSTKGEGRGLGLSNLSAFLSQENNVSLETQIIKNQFIQRVIIGG